MENILFHLNDFLNLKNIINYINQEFYMFVSGFFIVLLISIKKYLSKMFSYALDGLKTHIVNDIKDGLGVQNVDRNIKINFKDVSELRKQISVVATHLASLTKSHNNLVRRHNNDDVRDKNAVNKINTKIEIMFNDVKNLSSMLNAMMNFINKT